MLCSIILILILIQYHPLRSAESNRNHTTNHIFYYSIAHCTFASSRLCCGCCWHFNNIHNFFFYLECVLHFRAQIIRQPFGCWLLCLFFFIHILFFVVDKQCSFDRDPGSQNLLFGLLWFRFFSLLLVVIPLIIDRWLAKKKKKNVALICHPPHRMK